METKGKTLVTKRKILLGDQREDLCDSAKHNQLPAGPREKRTIGRLFSSCLYFEVVIYPGGESEGETAYG